MKGIINHFEIIALYYVYQPLMIIIHAFVVCLLLFNPHVFVFSLIFIARSLLCYESYAFWWRISTTPDIVQKIFSMSIGRRMGRRRMFGRADLPQIIADKKIPSTLAKMYVLRFRSVADTRYTLHIYHHCVVLGVLQTKNFLISLSIVLFAKHNIDWYRKNCRRIAQNLCLWIIY